MNYLKSLLIITIIILLNGCGNGNEVNTIEASGNIEATNVTISAKTGGQIKQLVKDEGSTVNRGDTLVIIDHELLDYQLEQAEARVEALEAQLNLLKKGARKEDISQAKNVVNQARINYETANKDLERFSNLYESRSITKKQFEDAQSRFDIAEAQYNSAKENLNKMKNIARPEELQQAEANLKSAEASTTLIQKNISDSYVTSPLNGIIVRQFVEVGESVAPSASLLRIADLKKVNLKIYVSEIELGKVKIRQKVNVKIDAFNNKIYEGEVIYISPEAEFTPKNIQTKDERTKLVFEVKIKVNNPDLELKAGMPADAEILV